MIHRREQGFLVERAQPLQRIERVQSRQRKLSAAREFLQRIDGRFVLAFVDEALGGFAPPGIRMRERGDEFGGAGLAKARRRRCFEILRRHAQDAAPVASAVEIEILQDIVGDCALVLDDFAIHAGDVEAAVRAVVEIHRAKPHVARSDEFTLRRLIGPRGFETDAVGFKSQTDDNIISRFTEKNVAPILLREC